MKISRWSRIDTRWYLAVRCAKCQSPIFFALDYSDGVEDRNSSPPPEKLVLTCTLASCGLRSDYTSAAIMRLQKQPVGAAPRDVVNAG
jgi:hypothetical protein